MATGVTVWQKLQQPEASRLPRQISTPPFSFRVLLSLTGTDCAFKPESYLKKKNEIKKNKPTLDSVPAAYHQLLISEFRPCQQTTSHPSAGGDG